MKLPILLLFLIPMTAQAQLDSVIVKGKLVPYSIKLDTIPKEYMKSDSFPKYQVIHGGFSILKLDPPEESSIQQMTPDYFIKLSLVITGDTAKAIYSLMQYIRSLSPVKNALAPLPSPRPQASTDTLPKLKSMIAPALCMFVSGAADGTMDYLSYHYDGNSQFWQPRISWTNKYKHHDPTQGERFPGSTTVFVAFTDGWHMCKMIRNTSTVAAVVLNLGHKEKWYNYLFRGLVYTAVNRLGFVVTYYWIFKH